MIRLKPFIMIITVLFLLPGCTVGSKSSGDASAQDTTYGNSGIVRYAGKGYYDQSLSLISNSSGQIFATGYTTDSGNTQLMALWKYTSDGVLDTTFGNSGVATYSGGSYDVGNRAIIDSSGRILVVGYSGLNMAIWRYTSGGVLDSTFGNSGIVTYSGDGNLARGNGIIVNSSGYIIASGFSLNSDKHIVMTIWKYTSAGTAASSFGTGSVVSYSGTGNNDCSNAITLDSSNNIYVAGYSVNAKKQNMMAVWKYTSAGGADSSFGTGGVVLYSGTGNNDCSTAITLDSSNNVYVAGYSYSSDSQMMVIRKYTSGGIPDSSFGTGGTVNYTGSGVINYGSGISIDGSGNIFVTGSADSDSLQQMTIWKYNSNGSTDTSFGSGGLVTYYVSDYYDHSNDIVLDNSGRILVTGYRLNSEKKTMMVLWRYNSNGTLDSTFNPL